MTVSPPMTVSLGHLPHSHCGDVFPGTMSYYHSMLSILSIVYSLTMDPFLQCLLISALREMVSDVMVSSLKLDSCAGGVTFKPNSCIGFKELGDYWSVIIGAACNLQLILCLWCWVFLTLLKTQGWSCVILGTFLPVALQLLSTF